MNISRRDFVNGATSIALLSGSQAASATSEKSSKRFDFAVVIDRAQSLSRSPFKPRSPKPPPGLAGITYDQYRNIRFRDDQKLWRDEGAFQVQLFHTGFLFTDSVTINIVVDETVTALPYSRSMFDVTATGLAEAALQGGGFAGFRLHHPLLRPDYFDEFAVFLGASYFRLIGRDQAYGASCRGLAIDTALPTGEEFPAFTEFWLERPKPDASSVVVNALLESPSVVGAFRFVLRPRDATEADVQAVLFPRRDIAKLGLAPLTSMFLHGEDDQRFGYLRHEVHDSDGLAAQNGQGEWLWRPLVNRRRLQTSAFLDRNPIGFGLLQRERAPARYLDVEGSYDRRPSLWVTPRSGFEAGRVELTEIPSDKEIHDNIVVAWVPETPAKAGDVIRLSYLIAAQGDGGVDAKTGRAIFTRVGPIPQTGVTRWLSAAASRFLVGFQGGELVRLRDVQPVTAVLSASAGVIASNVVTCEGGVWTACFEFTPPADGQSELRCYLSLHGVALSETWSYLWTA